MTDAEFQWLASSDPRLAAYAASRLPAWLWTADGTRILWANAAGARLFGAASAAALADKTFGPADRHRRQVARLAGRLLAGSAIRLERLQGFGAAPGMLSTCGCSRFDFPNGSHGVLIAAGNIALITPRRALQPSLKKPSDRPTGTGGRSRGSQTDCRQTAPSGWSACRASARRSAGLRPAAACGSIFPMAVTAS